MNKPQGQVERPKNNQSEQQRGKKPIISLLGYEQVSDRIELFYKQNPNGCIITSLITSEPKCTTEAVVAAYIFKEKPESVEIITPPSMFIHNPHLPLFSCDGFGITREEKGKGWANKNDWIENCETSAVGRALDSGGYGSGACREEIIYVNRANDPDAPITDEQKKKISELRKETFSSDKEWSKWVLIKFKVVVRDLDGVQADEIIHILENPVKKKHYTEYETVAEMNKRFHETFPDGKMVSRLLTTSENLDNRAVIQSSVFKDGLVKPINPDLLRFRFNDGKGFYETLSEQGIYIPMYLADGIGHAVEIAGIKGASEFKWLENCETSARGRAFRHTNLSLDLTKESQECVLNQDKNLNVEESEPQEGSISEGPIE